MICSKFLNLTWIETLQWHHSIYSTGPSNKIFIRTLFVFNSCYVIHIEWTYLSFGHVLVYEQLCWHWWYYSIYFLLGHETEHNNYHKLGFTYCNTSTFIFSYFYIHWFLCSSSHQQELFLNTLNLFFLIKNFIHLLTKSKDTTTRYLTIRWPL